MSKQDPSVSVISNGLFSNTRADSIIYGLVEVYHTNRKGALLGYNHHISIMGGASVTAIDLPNFDAIAYLKNSLLIQIKANFWPSKIQACGFGMSVDDVSNRFNDKQYIHYL